LTERHLGWPVHGEVAGSRGGQRGRDGRSVRAGTQKVGRLGQAGEECRRVGEREGEKTWAGFGPAEGGFPFFSFSFPISFYLTPFSFKQKFI
jgi:hypothetical protein